MSNGNDHSARETAVVSPLFLQKKLRTLTLEPTQISKMELFAKIVNG